MEREGVGWGWAWKGQSPSVELQELGGVCPWVIPQLRWDYSFALFDTLIFPAEPWGGTVSC